MHKAEKRAFRSGFKLPAAASGILIIILAVLFFTGTLSFQNDAREVISSGNHLFASGDYNGAISIYQKGLENHPEQLVLFYNSGQAAYKSGNYSKAAEYYSYAPDYPDKYINQGNSYLKLADTVEDPDLKLSGYQKALDTYKEGMICFPENTELKFNYEFVKKILDQAEGDQNQKNNEDGEKEQDQNSKEDKEQQQQEKDGSESGETTQKQDGSASADANSQAVSETPQTESEIAAVMSLIEQQEKESLKNNQEVNGQEEEGSANGW